MAIDATATLAPDATATEPAVVAAADQATATPADVAATCQTDDAVTGPPTIAPMGGDVPPAADDDPCAPAAGTESPGAEAATATTVAAAPSAVTPQPDVPDATVTVAEGNTVDESPTAAPLEAGAEATATTEGMIVGKTPTETPVPVVPDSSAEVATEPPSDGVTLPGGTVAAVSTEPDVPEATVDVTAESTGVDGGEPVEVAVGLPVANAPGGPLPVSPNQNRFVLGTNGGQLWIVGFDGGAVPINGSEPFYPVWSPDGSQLLIAYYPDNSEGSSLGLVDAGSGQVTALTSQGDDLLQRDVPAGWLDQTPVFQRNYPDDPSRGIELWRGGDDAPFWTIEGAEAFTTHPIATAQGFLLATSAGWIEVGAGGNATTLGPSPLSGRIDEVAVKSGGMLAYAGQGQLVIASIGAPGNPDAVLPYAGAGFDWAPDGSQLVIATGSTLTFVTPDGATVAEVPVSAGGTVSGPYWTGEGIRFVDSAAGALRQIAAPA